MIPLFTFEKFYKFSRFLSVLMIKEIKLMDNLETFGIYTFENVHQRQRYMLELF